MQKQIKQTAFIFSFSKVTKNELVKELLSLDTSKASQYSDIPTQILIENSDIFAEFLFANYNASVAENSIFPSVLKLADITPVFKNGDKECKDNYRPVSILSNVSKVFERIIFRQISNYMEPFLSKYQCGFRKDYSTQHCLLSMLEKWKRTEDNGKVFGILLTDLSKAFDCLSHELLLAKLHAYGFSLSALRLIHSYLTNRKQRTKINSSYSSWEEILFGVPQGSILGPLLFNVFLCDMFFVVSQTDFAAYADDNTPYVEGNNIDEVINMLENDSIQLFKWFSDNQMKANKDKCHLIVGNNVKVSMKIDSIEVENSHCEKLLGVKVDRELKFKEHLEGIIKKASKKVNVLSRIIPYMNIAKRKLLMNSFFISQFNYCPLIWRCHSRTINNKINSLHGRCLRIIYNDYRSSFEYLLGRDKGVTICLKNVRTLAIEMFKMSKNLSPQLVTEIFEKRNNVYDLRNPSEFVRPRIRSVFNGEESISYLRPKIWDIIPPELKALETVNAFKREI